MSNLTTGAWIALGIGVIAVILVIFILKWIFSLRRVVAPNEVHVVRQGKKTLVYGRVEKVDSSGNSYYEWPVWIPGLGVNVTVLPLSVFSINLDNYSAYDKDRLPFVVDIQAYFRISNYEVAASRIPDFRELKQQLLGILQGASRSLLANEVLEDIMGKRTEYGDKFTSAVKTQLSSWGVETVKNIELMDIRDERGEVVIDNIMKKKKSEIERDSRVTVAQNTQAAREAEIAAEQEVALKEQAKEETVGKRTAEREKSVGIAREQAQQEIQTQAKETKTREMEVLQVDTVRRAEIGKQKAIVDSEAHQASEKIDADTRVLVAAQGKVAAGHEAEAALIKTTKEAEGRLVVAQNEAKGVEVRGLAEATAREKLGLAEAVAKEKLGQAEVAPQITLAKEIGENEGYQSYLIEVKKVEANQAVGMEQAKNLGNAQIKIVANAGGNVQEGVSSVMDLFSAKGGQSLGAMLETFAGTEQGKKLLAKLFGKKDE